MGEGRGEGALRSVTLRYFPAFAFFLAAFAPLLATLATAAFGIAFSAIAVFFAGAFLVAMAFAGAAFIGTAFIDAAFFPDFPNAFSHPAPYSFVAPFRITLIDSSTKNV